MLRHTFKGAHAAATGNTCRVNTRRLACALAAAAAMVPLAAAAQSVGQPSTHTASASTRLPLRNAVWQNQQRRVHVSQSSGSAVGTGVTATVPRLHVPRRPGTSPSSGPARVVTVESNSSQVAAVPPLVNTRSFTGVSFDDQKSLLGGVAVTPPDTQVAAGPTQVVEMVNEAMYVFARSNGAVTKTTFDTLFGNTGGCYSDPWVFYDAMSGHFFASVLVLQGAPCSGATLSGSYVLIAHTATSDALTWVVGVLFGSKVTPDGFIHDQPKLGVTDDKISFAFTDFRASDLSFLGGTQGVLNKAQVLAGGAFSGALLPPQDPNRAALGPVRNVTSGATAYLVDTRNANQLFVITVTGVPGVSPPIGNETAVTVNPYTLPPSAQQPGGTIDSGDIRPLSMLWQGGLLWVTTNDVCMPGGATHNCLRVFQLTTSGTIALPQDFDIGQSGADLIYPAVGLDRTGDAFVVATKSGTAINPSLVAFAELATSTNTIDASSTLRAGSAFTFTGLGNPPRWGDYSGATVDPNDTSIVWVAGEYQAATSAPDGANWGTELDALSLATMTSVTPNSGPTAGGTVTRVNGTGFLPGSTVMFGATPATTAFVNSGRLTATAPAGAGAASVTVNTPSGAASGSATFTYLTLAAAQPYHALPNPGRLLDTRCPFGGTHLGPGGTLDLDVTGHLLVAPCSSGALSGVPAGATAVVLDVIAISPSAPTPTFITVYPTGSQQPLASSLNTFGGVVPNLVEVAVGSANKVRFFNAQGTVDLVADIEGYVAPSGDSSGLFNPTSPARICDTRGGQPANQCNTPQPQPLGPGLSATIQVTGKGGIPATGVSAVAMNVTVTNTTAAAYLTVWPTGKPRPTASNLNFSQGQTVANRVIVGVGTSGTISVFNSAGSLDLVIDVNGYFTDPTVSTGSKFTPLSPERDCDTRSVNVTLANPCSSLTIAASGTLTLRLAGVGNIPAMAAANPPTAVVLNLTVVQPSASTYEQVYPGTDPAPSPPTSDINVATGGILANMVVVRIGTDGTIKIVNAAGSTDIVIDVAGWYA